MTEVAPIAETVRIDGAVWRFCPVGGYECFRILNDGGQVAKDVIAVHVEVSHGLHAWLASVASLTSGPIDASCPAPIGDPPPKRPSPREYRQRSIERKAKNAAQAETHGSAEVACS